MAIKFSFEDLAKRRDELLADKAAKDALTINKTQLKARGWTDSLIEVLLPQPHVEKRHSREYGNYVVHLWDTSVVERAELDDAFIEARRRRFRVKEGRHGGAPIIDMEKTP